MTKDRLWELLEALRPPDAHLAVHTPVWTPDTPGSPSWSRIVVIHTWRMSPQEMKDVEVELPVHVRMRFLHASDVEEFRALCAVVLADPRVGYSELVRLKASWKGYAFGHEEDRIPL